MSSFLLTAALALANRTVVQADLKEEGLIVIRPALGHHVVSQYLSAVPLKGSYRRNICSGAIGTCRRAI